MTTNNITKVNIYAETTTEQQKRNALKSVKAARITNIKMYLENLVAKYGVDDDTNKPLLNIIDYTEKTSGLYRLQLLINGKYKTIARIKAQKDIYILIKEDTANACNIQYEKILYNLPAGFHTDYDYIRNVTPKLDSIIAYHRENGYTA